MCATLFGLATESQKQENRKCDKRNARTVLNQSVYTQNTMHYFLNITGRLLKKFRIMESQHKTGKWPKIPLDTTHTLLLDDSVSDSGFRAYRIVHHHVIDTQPEIPTDLNNVQWNWSQNTFRLLQKFRIFQLDDVKVNYNLDLVHTIHRTIRALLSFHCLTLTFSWSNDSVRIQKKKKTRFTESFRRTIYSDWP